MLRPSRISFPRPLSAAGSALTKQVNRPDDRGLSVLLPRREDSDDDVMSTDRPSRTGKRGLLLLLLAVAGVLVIIGAIALVKSLHRHDSPYRVTATVPVGRGTSRVAVDPVMHAVYVANFGDHTVSVIDAKTHTVTATVQVGRWPNDVAVDSGTHTVYVSTSTEPMSVIDGSTHTVTATVGGALNGVAVDPGTHTVYAATGHDTVSVLDGSSHSVTATVPLEYPVHLAVD